MVKPGFVVLKVSKALLARCLFASHNLAAIWQLSKITDNLWFWLLGIAPIVLFVEAAVTILRRYGAEYKWVCPAIFIFLCGSVPPIWLLEIDETLLSRKQLQAAANISLSRTMLRKSTTSMERVVAIGTLKVDIPSFFPAERWRELLEQALLVILVVGRWLLPKGSLSRDELSQLLLAYLAISSDIVELFNLFSHDEVRQDVQLTLIVLVMWTVSLVQFVMVITTVKGQKARYCWSTSSVKRATTQKARKKLLLASQEERSLSYEILDLENKQSIFSTVNFGAATVIGTTNSGITSKADSYPMLNHSLQQPKLARRRSFVQSIESVKKKMTSVAVWGIVSTVLLQDGPFFGLRIYMIFCKGIRGYTLYFFVAKNSLIISVQLYRLFVLCFE